MATWIIEPRDPLIARDGRPFGRIPGARAASLAFPFPSTITGGVRTRAGLEAGGSFSPERITALKQVAVRGPLMVELDEKDEISQWYAPAPADSIILDLEPAETHRAVRRQLAPLEPPAAGRSDLNLKYPNINVVGLAEADPCKPRTDAPRFWRWAAFEKWLAAPEDGVVTLSELGNDGPIQDTRVHVNIQPGSQTAAEGALFQTRGLEFTLGQGRERLALAVVTDAAISGGISPLGGERRIVTWRHSSVALPACTGEIRQRIVRSKSCRAVLLTPACFEQGWLPRWLLEQRHGVRPRLRGAAIQRPQVVSGWDFSRATAADNGRPKPSRRLAASGTVFFLSLEGDQAAVGRWVDKAWMSCASDDPQDRFDGFGLTVLGTWSGELRQMR